MRLTAALIISLLAVSCTKRSGHVTIDPPAESGTKKDEPGKPDEPSPVKTDPAIVLMKNTFGSQFIGGSQFAFDNEEELEVPERREQAQTWIDRDANFWLFSGKNIKGLLSDLWQFDKATKHWTKVPLSAEYPEARVGAITWTDKDGALHLLGGENTEALSDHWVYQNQSWTRVAGEDTFVRTQAATALTADGSLFAFGGKQKGELKSDLWVLEAGALSWKNLESSGKGPGPRRAADLWIDKNNKIWLHAGFGNDQDGRSGHLNELWVYNPDLKSWTLISGQEKIDACQEDIPELQGPVSRAGASTWTDASGKFWLFGGETLIRCGKVTLLNDLWFFTPETKLWSLVKKRSFDPRGRYEAPASSFGIGARSFAASYFDTTTQKLWIFGGFGHAVDPLPGDLRDFWLISGETVP